MRRTWRAFALFGALLLGACGGGGGGDNGGSPAQQQPTTVPPPAPSGPLTLTENNTVDATSLVMRATEHVHVAAESMIFTANVLLFRNTLATTVSCDDNVLARLSNIDNDSSRNISSGDVLRFEFTSCAGATRDTTMLITDVDYAGKISGRVTFAETTNTGAQVEGSFSYASVFNAANLEQTQTMTDIVVTVASGGVTAAITEAQSTRYLHADTYRVTTSGRANSPSIGRELTFATPTPFSGDFGEVPTTGELQLVGGTSRARVTPSTDPAFRDDHFAYQVDAAGTGTYSAVQHGRWSTAVVGLIFCWDANARPEITSLSLSPANPSASDTLTASYAATDLDGDPLFYFPDWRVNGSQIFVGGTTLPLARFKKGDVVTYVLRVSDSRAEAVASASLTIGNSPPRNVTATLEPTVVRTTDDIVIRHGSLDIDQGDFPQATFEWLRNGVPIPGQTGQVLPHTQQAKGQVITGVVHISDGEAVTSASASTTIVDTPPVIAIPTSIDPVPYGQTLTFDVTASDVDGDSTGQFILDHGPAGMTLNPTTGRVSWPMRGPGFETTAYMNYGVTLDVPAAPLERGAVMLNAPNRAKPLFANGIEGPVTSGLVAGDFDDDDNVELLVAGQNLLYELEWNGARLRQSWAYASPFNTNKPPTALAAADVDGDGKHEIFVAHGYEVTRLDGVDRRPVALGGLYPDLLLRDLEVADVDEDGRLDLVTIVSANRSAHPTSKGVVVIYFGALGSGFVWDYPIDEGSAIAVGNVDGDPQLEIVTNSGYVFDVFNWLNHWRHPTPFGWEIDVGDLDGDGVDEIVAAVDDGAVRAYDGMARTVKWTIPNVDTDAIVIADVVGDAKKEVVVGDGVGGNGLVKVYAQTAPNAATLVAGINAVGDDVPAIATGDVDNDGDVELIWGSTTPGPSITIAGGAPLDVEWTTADLSHGALLGPYVGGELARRPAGAPTVLFATTRSAGGGARLIGMDTATGDLTVSADLGAPGNGSLAMAVVDYDNDGTQEALLASSSGDTAYHRAYDFFGGSVEWNSTFASTENGVAVAHGNLTGDTRAELVAIDLQGVVRAYAIGSTTPFFESQALANGRDVAIAELTGGGRPEILVAAGDRIRIFSSDNPSSTYTQTRINPATLPDLRDIEVVDIDGDGALEIFALYGVEASPIPTSVQRLDSTLAVRGGFDYWRWARGLTVERSSFPRKNLVLTEKIEGDQLIVVDPDTGDEIWQSPALLGSIARDGVHFVDVAGDGALRISVATSRGMYLTR